MEKQQKTQEIKAPAPNVFGLLKPYGWLLFFTILLGLSTNGLNLVLPKIIASAIDSYSSGHLVFKTVITEFFLLSLFVFIFAYVQSVVQTYTSEKVARDLREKIVLKISNQSYSYIEEVTSSKLLTNLTSDIDAIKLFVGQAVVVIISSVFLVVGGSVLLILINWKLAITVLLLLALIAVAFFFVFSKMGPLFKKSQGVIDWLNKVINESVLGASLIRVLNSQAPEYNKFIAANTEAKNVGLDILKLFATVIPIVSFVASLATLTILLLGGHFVIDGSMTLGNFTAFVSYLGILIFPIIIIGFMSSSISRASASYARVSDTLNAKDKPETGTIDQDIRGDVEITDACLSFGEKVILKNVSFKVQAGSKTALLGPTAAGKTHLLYLLIGLLSPDKGTIKFDDKLIDDYDKHALHQQIGFVFQDSIIFNMTLRENIAFSNIAEEVNIEKAIETAELSDFVSSLPNGLDTIVSERGTSLSGGQKQRIMLARALALNPKILLLDDFTARIDASTEQKILNNVARNYPGITLISVTQKIAAIERYEQIILLMEGEVLAKGTHKELMEKSPEYVQIFDSQRSTSHYEEEKA
jgi:ATP-binding cassette subfamily B protein